MTKRRSALCGLVALLSLAVWDGPQLQAQQEPSVTPPVPRVPGAAAPRPLGEYPLAPVRPRGNIVAPYFDGWIQHPDGSRTYSFGFLNRNQDEVLEIPIGPDNFIEPAEFNGMQPTYFPPVGYGGFGGPRERGAFAVRVPPGFEEDVVWTLRSQGETHFVPGRATSVAYELSTTPQAAGSYRPLVRFDPGGASGWGPEGIFAEETVVTSVGAPVTLTVWGEDRGEREPVALSATWQKHQGPVGGQVEFEPATTRLDLEGEEGAMAATTATFSEPGEYVVRVRLDNFTAPDSSFGNQCCWSNGYVRVDVTP